MQKKLKRILACLIASTPLVSLSCVGCSNYEGIVVANFESYMSSKLMDDVHDEYKCKFLYYDTNETIETKFEKNYDIAIPSSYESMILKKKGYLSKIDWSLFNLKAFDPNTGQVIDVKTSSDAFYLFSESTQAVLSALDDVYQNTKYEDGSYYLEANEHVLDYGIPYFVQSWMFAYDGCEQIPSLSGELTWLDVAKAISANSFFDKSGSKANIACIDDSRTFYGMCKLVYDQTNGVSESDWNINPPNKDQSIDMYKKQYESFAKYFKSDTFYFNSDSNQILLSLADPKGAHGAFCYNGDAIYALTGGGMEKWEEKWNNTNFHAVMPKDTVITMDMLVLNNKNNNDQDTKQQVYDIAKAISLNGSSYEDKDKINQKDDNGDYIYGPMENFSFISYTDPLKNVNDYILNPGGYIDTEIKQANQRELFRQMYNIVVSTQQNLKGLFEIPLNDLDKSNMHWAYEPTKEKL